MLVFRGTLQVVPKKIIHAVFLINILEQLELWNAFSTLLLNKPAIFH